ncbi:MULTISPECIES: hypothetical protein [Methylobacterium]|jgi:hypothetical protein|uniref:Uncharacterized protein n=1 Tax=Methylobacterium longum TaxID=767694 RepID=A0ABT8AX52_9HYPH|nr:MULTISPECIES: hypothetical protein [Methylobacterium]MCJ2103688.1 hypothetical protein [Methylobacterium sp. E-046]MDN3574537.1 hypothetical protein [Methylobacterium longum]GJE09321.1 hypothetical protein FOHLNKBM_0343 [Methylobacterium longum]
MRTTRTLNTSGRKNIAVLAALAISSLVATPFVMSASRALATSEEQPVAATLRVEPVEVTPVAAAPKAEGTCLRKVRVVYSGYGKPADGCAAH